VISVVASLQGNPDLAVGNVMGSNLANIGLVLGISAIIRPLHVSTKVVMREVWVMVGMTLLLLPLIWDSQIGRLEGSLLVTMLVFYLTYVVWRSKKDGPEAPHVEQHEETGDLSSRMILRHSALTVGGVLGLVLGAFAIRGSAVALAEAMGISELVIGLTLVSIGTSLPELACCVVAALRHEADIAVGNILGSNIFNITFVLGVTSILSPLGFHPDVLRLEFPAVMVITVLLVPIVRHRLVIRRRQGFLLLSTYLLLFAFLVMG
jgi:cation:H+ antiporter